MYMYSNSMASSSANRPNSKTFDRPAISLKNDVYTQYNPDKKWVKYGSNIYHS